MVTSSVFCKKTASIDYAYQSLSSIPELNETTKEQIKDRTKPWGTGQAVLAAKDMISTPFAVINADDYYGKEAYRAMHDWLCESHEPTMKIRSWAWSCGPTVFRERSWGTVLRMKHSRQKWIGYLLFDAAIRPSFVARLRLSPRLGRIFFNKQTSNQLNAQLVIAICSFLFILLLFFPILFLSRCKDIV